MLSDQAFTRKGNKSYLMISSYLLVTFTDRSAQEKTDSPSSPDLRPFKPAYGAAELFPSCPTAGQFLLPCQRWAEGLWAHPSAPAPSNTQNQILVLSKQLEALSRCSRAWIASSLNTPQIPSRFSSFWFCSRN